eukprot:jgi/Chlat1/3227/Chrsp22S03506
MAKLVLLLAFLLATSATLSGVVHAADPDPTYDLFDPNASVAATFNGLPASPGPVSPGGMVQRLNALNFPALTGQGQSLGLLTFKACSQNSPHTHPRASEMLYVISGQITVMLIDTSLTLRTSTLRAGDVAINPRGLLHMETNFNCEEDALVLATFNSQNPGTLLASDSLFSTPFDVLSITTGLPIRKLEKIQAMLNSTGKLPVGSFRAGDLGNCYRAQRNYPLTFPNGYQG